ncbi:endonuclease III [Candidatus Woesearchaeota archaeon]|nr:endonuclease III [Candidatus Woesearchaeota archaeon]
MVRKKVDIRRVYRILEREYPRWHVPVVDLVEAQTRDPFKVLVATLLSAQTRDAVTARVSERLFSRVADLEDLEEVSEDELRELIRPVSYYNTKAKHLKRLAPMLREEFGGKVPETVEELVRLPGVGRKTANVTVAVAFRKPAIGTDTHVHRISNRLGYVRTKTRYETEMRLRQKLPKELWINYNTYLVALGQRICTPISPKCSECPLYDECNRVGVTRSR